MIPEKAFLFKEKNPVVAGERKISLFALLSVWQNASPGRSWHSRKEKEGRREGGKELTHGEDFLRQPPRPHVGVVDLLEDHPGLVMLPHLTEGTEEAGKGSRGGINGIRARATHIYTHTHTHTYVYI